MYTIFLLPAYFAVALLMQSAVSSIFCASFLSSELKAMGGTFLLVLWNQKQLNSIFHSQFSQCSLAMQLSIILFNFSFISSPYCFLSCQLLFTHLFMTLSMLIYFIRMPSIILNCFLLLSIIITHLWIIYDNRYLLYDAKYVPGCIWFVNTLTNPDIIDDIYIIDCFYWIAGT